MKGLMRLNSLRALNDSSEVAQLRVDADGTIGSVETAVHEFFRHTSQEPSFLELDLSSCEYIEVSSLIYFISFIKSRLNRGLYTYVRIPVSETVRDFLRIWEFPRAVRQATGI